MSWIDDLIGIKEILFSGTPLAKRARLNFTGPGVSVADNPITGATDVTILSGEGGEGSGDVSGPASSTDNAVARFDSTTGKLIQNSLVTIDDLGNISLPASRTVDGRDVSADGAVIDNLPNVYQARSEKDQANGYAGLDGSGKVAGTALPYGDTANTACEGNDPRLSDARTPTAHTHDVSDVTGAVPTSRTVTATSPIRVNGGDSANLGSNLTFALVAGTVLNQVLSWSGTAWVAKLLGISDIDGLQTALDGKAALTSDAPATITKATAQVGVAATAARADHKHDIATGAPSTIGSSNVEGTSTSLARADHVHAHGNLGGGSMHAEATTSAAGFMSAADKQKLDGIAASATNTPLSSSTPAAVGSAGSAGASTSASRADHVHAHGDQAGGSLHATATTSVAGFMSAADKTKLDGIASGATNTPLTNTAPTDVTKSAASVGVSTQAARADHKHNIATAAPSTIGTSNSEGSSTSLARADHIHAHGNLAGGTLHAAANASTAGFQSADHYNVVEAMRRGFPDDAVTPGDANRDLALTDLGRIVDMAAATAERTITIPPQSSVSWPSKCPAVFIHAGVHPVHIAAGAGVTLTAPKGFKASVLPGGVAKLVRIGSNAWYVSNDLFPDYPDGIDSNLTIASKLTTTSTGFVHLIEIEPSTLLRDNSTYIFEGTVIARVDGHNEEGYNLPYVYTFKIIGVAHTANDGSISVGHHVTSVGIDTDARLITLESPSTNSISILSPFFDIKDGILVLVTSHPFQKDGVNIYWGVELAVRNLTTPELAVFF